VKSRSKTESGLAALAWTVQVWAMTGREEKIEKLQMSNSATKIRGILLDRVCLISLP
jgi:hypothetical protein